MFCEHCGFSIPAAPRATPPAAIVRSGNLCPNCGAPMRWDSDFCGECGTQSIAPAVAATPQPLPLPSSPRPLVADSAIAPARIRCVNCGIVMPAGTVFCQECGTPVAGALAPLNPTPRVTPASPPLPPPQTVNYPPQSIPPREAQPDYGTPPPDYGTPPPMPPEIPTPKGKSHIGLIVGLVVLLLALGAGGFFGYRYYVARNSAPITPTQVVLNTPPEQPATQAPVTPPSDPNATPATPPPVEQAPAPAPTATGKKAAGARSNAKNTPPPTRASNTPAAPAATTATPSPEPVAAPPKREPPKPVAPVYAGPSSGLLLWSGPLPKKEDVTIDGSSTTAGSILQGILPGVPVTITTELKDVTISEPPSAANNWKRLSFHGKKERKTVVTFHWTVQ